MAKAIKRTNRAGTCLYCGATLKPQYHLHQQGFKSKPVTVRTDYSDGTYEERTVERGGFRVNEGERPFGYGYRGKNHFCTLTCGWRFGLAMAEGGRRLTPRTEA